MEKIKILEESRFLSTKSMMDIKGGNGPLVCGDGSVYKSCANPSTFTVCTEQFYIGTCITLYLDCDFYGNCDNSYFVCTKKDNYNVTIEFL